MKKTFYIFLISYCTWSCKTKQETSNNVTEKKDSATITIAAPAVDYYIPEIRYEDFIYNDNIRTVTFNEISWEQSPPLIRLNSTQQLKFGFDDLARDIKDYSYSLIHCNANWEPSGLIPAEYMDGFLEENITNFKRSFNTLQQYVHYEMVFPTSNFKMTKTGNYILKIYENGKPDNPTITRRFCVFEDLVNVAANVHQATIVEDRNYRQEVDFSIFHQNYNLTNPYSDLKVVVTQNDRWDNAIYSLKPMFVKDRELTYDYDSDNTFNGGNEFRYFDFKNLYYNSEFVRKTIRDTLTNHVFLFPAERRSFKRYLTQKDINGKFVIRYNNNNQNGNYEADYAWVHFQLPYDMELTDGSVYVFGALSNWQCKNEFRMKFNPQTMCYELAAYLKQGYYNYNFVFLKDGNKKADETYFEGSHYETENEYTIYVYHRQIGSNYDQLIAVKKSNSIF